MSRLKPLIACSLSLGLLLSCASSPRPAATALPIVAQPSPGASPSASPPAPAAELSLTARIEAQLGLATPTGIAAAVSLVREAHAESTEFGRAILYAAAWLRTRLYPDLPAPDWAIDPPRLNPLVRVLDEAQAGRWADSALRGASPLADLLACAVVAAGGADAGTVESALSELARLGDSGLSSALLTWLPAIAAERRSAWSDSLELYSRTAAFAPDCYPAEIGKVQALVNLGKSSQALSLLEGLKSRYPDNPAVSKLLARAYYDQGRYDKAAPLVMDALRSDPSNGDLILMRAHILALQGSWLQAGPLLDAIATAKPLDPLYLSLRALQLWKDKGQRQDALAALDKGLALYPEDVRLLVLKGQVLLDGSPSPADRSNAMDLLAAALAVSPKNLDALSLLSRECLRAGEYARASSYLDDYMAASASFSDWALAIDIALAAGRGAQALSWSQAWLSSSPADEAAASARLKALLKAGRPDQAQAFIADRLAGKAGPKLRSELLCARARYQRDPDAALSDLRASLMEDPRNLDALLAMCDYYQGQKDYRKARTYLKQAESVSPESAEVSARKKLPGLALP